MGRGGSVAARGWRTHDAGPGELTEVLMEDSALALVLSEVLEAVEAGGDAEDVLERYPALRDDLLPYVQIARRLVNSRDAVSMPPFPAESLRRRLRAAGAI